MAKDSPDRVLLGGHYDSNWVKDGIATAAVTPGDLVEVTGYDTTGADDSQQLQWHSSVPSTETEGSALPRFALPYSKTGKGIDDDYAADDHVEYVTARTGVEVYALLAAGESVTVDDPLESAGNGKLALHTGSDDADTTATQTYYDGAVVGHALEAVDNSGGSNPVRVRVEVR